MLKRAIWLLCVLLLLYAAYLITTLAQAYSVLKANKGDYYGFTLTHQTDSIASWLPKPGAHNYAYIYTTGEKIPVVIDRQGTRIPENDTIDYSNPAKILFLGASYTFGHGVAAEDAFPEVAAHLINPNAECVNASVCGQGYITHLLRARKFIPALKPQLVVVEFQENLMERCYQLYLATAPVHHTLPYFSDAPGGGFDINPPLFENNLDTFLQKINGLHPASAGEFLFLLRHGIPYVVNDNLRWLAATMRLKTGAAPPPTRKRQEILDYALAEIDALCAQYGAKMLVAGIRYNTHQYTVDTTRYCYVDAERVLLDKLAAAGAAEIPQLIADNNIYLWMDTAKLYINTYLITRGTPPVLVNAHYNSYGNRIVAQAIAEKAKECFPELVRSESE